MYARTEAGGLCEVEAVLRQSRHGGQGRVINGHLRGRPAPTALAFQLQTIIFHLQLLDLPLSDHPHSDKMSYLSFLLENNEKHCCKRKHLGVIVPINLIRGTARR